MNERSPRGYNPDDKLTAPKTNAYAKSGVNYMAAEGTVDSQLTDSGSSSILDRTGRNFNAESHQSGLVDRTGRPLGAQSGQSQERSEIQTPPIHPDDAPFTLLADKMKHYEAWLEDHRRRYQTEPSVDEKRAYQHMADLGPPQWYNPAENADTGIQFTQRSRNEQLQDDESSPEERAIRQQRLQNLEAYTAQKAQSGEPVNGQMLEVYQDMIRRGYDPLSDMAQGGTSVTGRRQGTNTQEQQQVEGRRTSERQGRQIQNMNELLQEIMDYSEPKWAKGGDYALVKTEVGSDGVEHEVINQKNFALWVQSRMVFFHGEAPDDPLNVFQKVRLEREIRDISLGEMLENQDRYFRDVNGNQYGELADFTRLMLWQFGAYRADDLEYRMAMGDDEGISKVIAKQFYNNSHSKPGFNDMSVLANVMTMADNFDSVPKTREQARDGTKPEQPINDTRLGNAINTAFLTYFNISDAKKIRQLLGDQARFLLDPEIVREAIRQRARDKKFVDKNGDVTDDMARRFLESTTSGSKGANNSAEFLFNGEPVKELDLVSFINVYNVPTKQTDIAVIVNRLVGDAIKERYNINDTSARFAQLMASFMARPMGAGWRNDLLANANDAGAKPGKMFDYRLKMAGGNRGGMLGNPYSVFNLRASLVDYLTAARTETLVENSDGSIYKDDYGNTHYYSVIELMERMHEQGLNSVEVLKFARKLRPTDNSQRDWAQNHMNRAFEIFHDVTGSNEVDWSKFTEADNWGNVRINRQAFEKEVKDHFFKQIRYCYSTYGQLDFSKSIRYYDSQAINPETGQKGMWKDEPLAHTLFGTEILDIPAFWKKDYLKKDGKFVLRMGEKVVTKTYEHVIDPQLIQQNKELLWKQVALSRLANDIYAHRDYFSGDKRYNILYYKQLVKAIESIQDSLSGDESDSQGVKKVGRMFSDDQIKWLRDRALISDFTLYRDQIMRDFFGGSFDGFKKALESMFKSMFKMSK